MPMLFNILTVAALCLFYGMFAFAIAIGKMVMRGFERIRTYFLFALTIYIYLSNIFNLPIIGFLNTPFWNAPVLRWMGVAILYIGIVLYYIDVIQFGRNLAIGVDENSKGLTTTGFYALSRNPMYISFMIYWLGAFLAFSNLGMLLILLGEAVFYHLQVVYKEEPFLRQHYGAPYEEYCKEVRRWL